MRIGLVGIVFFMLAVCRAQIGSSIHTLYENNENGVLKHPPEFYLLEWEKDGKLQEKETPLSIVVDSMGRQEVRMLVNEASNPVLYTSNIETPVCADGECRLMHIRLYWTLLGEYAGFDRFPGLPLTKHDHDEFLQADYLKLHHLLSDKLSILERRSIDELVEKPKQPEVEGADALSGATIKEVKESVVGGALYSCYVAWHLVHGAIKEDIKEHTMSLINDAMVREMLNSNSVDYQMFALNQLEMEKYAEQVDRISEIFESSIPMVRTFIIKNLPDVFWSTEKLQRPFWNNFAKVDINSRSLLLDHLQYASKDTLEDLSSELSVMTKNQLRAYLQHLEEHKMTSKSLRKNLEAFSKNDSEKYAYLVAQYLEE
ncbi:hypothetical protein [uncultured Kriegella sp.]|uniref:hypothetical protein n=1 Tax=uncultured Kriegella sp. TaxID=1798910 RepID=UPI0030DD5B32|tara:strand:+ start:59015 stop:60130 length:1116 start_codon:yes stop_codon:yes gene_type:complete